MKVSSFNTTFISTTFNFSSQSVSLSPSNSLHNVVVKVLLSNIVITINDSDLSVVGGF